VERVVCAASMADPPAERPSEPPPRPEPPAEPTSDKADLIAVGIGCLVFVIMFIAIVIVAATRE
jgi:hypothetical protein